MAHSSPRSAPPTYAPIAARWLSQPLLRRELIAYARDRRTHLLFGAAFAAAAAAAFLLYTYGATSLLRRAGRPDGNGSSLFELLGVAQIVFAVWLAPLLLLLRATDARARAARELMHAALLDSRRIVFARFAGVMALTTLFWFAVLPFYGFVLLLGGVEAFEIAAATGIVLAAGALAAAAATYCAAVARSTRRALLGFAAFVALLTFGLPLFTTAASAGALELLGPAVRSGALARASVVMEIALGLTNSLGPIAALRDGHAYFAAANDAWGFRRPLFDLRAAAPLPAPFLTLTVVYVAASAALLRAAVRRT